MPPGNNINERQEPQNEKIQFQESPQKRGKKHTARREHRRRKSGIRADDGRQAV